MKKRNSQDAADQANADKVPTILRQLKNVETKQGSFVQLDFFAVGDPQPEVNFFSNLNKKI